MSIEHEFCHLCGFTEGLFPPPYRLVRLTWIDDPADDLRMVLAVGSIPIDGDVVLCSDCIRQIKRLSFSDIENAPPVPIRANTTGGKTREPIDDDLPF